jgi:CheY-like chemotaxis protein
MPLQQRILVVEDERIVAKDIQRNLQRLGYVAPDTAASCEEALKSRRWRGRIWC